MRKTTTGVQGFRKTGKNKGKWGYITKAEMKLRPYEFGYGTIYATTLRGAKIKLKRILKKNRRKK